MEMPENNGHLDSKQPFVGLQTDMTDLRMDLKVSPIPLMDICDETFFPGVGDHLLSLDPQIHGANKPKTELVDNAKLFLLAFIEMIMEKQKSFTIRARVKFASNLTIILKTNTPYEC